MYDISNTIILVIFPEAPGLAAILPSQGPGDPEWIAFNKMTQEVIWLSLKNSPDAAPRPGPTQ